MNRILDTYNMAPELTIMLAVVVVLVVLGLTMLAIFAAPAVFFGALFGTVLFLGVTLPLVAIYARLVL